MPSTTRKVEAKVIALDANPVPAPMAVNAIIMAPGQRADIALRMPGTEGETVDLILRKPSGDERVASFRATGQNLHRQLAELKPLALNPITEPDLANAETLEFVFGWSPAGDAPANPICGNLGYLFWSINRIASQGDSPDPITPLAIMKSGKSYILRLRNETPYEHPIHLHGLTFSLLRSNKRQIPRLLTDTVTASRRNHGSGPGRGQSRRLGLSLPRNRASENRANGFPAR